MMVAFTRICRGIFCIGAEIFVGWGGFGEFIILSVAQINEGGLMG